MATDAMIDDGMEIEFDDPEIARMREEAAKMQAMPDVAVESEQPQMGGQEMQETNGVEEGELSSTEPVPNKIYIESIQMSSLTTKDLENFAEDNSRVGFLRVEWINDTSAKLVYNDANAAETALNAFSTAPARSPLETRRAVTLVTHPHVELFVRQAVVTDMKQRGAASRSQFYDNNPIYRPDPEDRMRQYDRPRRRGPRAPAKKFDENLYDDDADSVAARRASQSASDSERDLFAGRQRGRAPRGRDQDLFAGRKNDRLRSASPARDGDGKYGFSDDVPQRKPARYRSPPPLRRRSAEANRSIANAVKAELFPNKKTSTALTNGGNTTELFPSHKSKATELFPERAGRRFDHQEDEAVNALGGWDLHKQSPQGSYRPSSRQLNNINGGDLLSRITGGPGMALKQDYGRLKSPDSFDSADGNFSFKGAGKQQGFSIRGASKDLFGGGNGGGGNDLFPNKIKPRKANHRLDEDMY